MNFDIVVPTVGRPELMRLLRGLDTSSGALPDHVFIVDDRADSTVPLIDGDALSGARWLPGRLVVLDNHGSRGPAAGRNRGWRCSRAEWVAFLDDDVLPRADWLDALGHDLAQAGRDPRVAASCGRISVPVPFGRRPTDWERDVGRLATATWATADMAYRRDSLAVVGGFDEGFPLAYREDADLAVRITKAGFDIVTGSRVVAHPVRTESRWISVRRQRGNAADARMRHKHGPRWRADAHAGRSRMPWHVAAVVSGAVAVGAAVTRRRKVARVAGLLWLVQTLAFAARRIRPGPRTLHEIVTMLATSAAIPPAAVAHRLRGELAERRRPPSLERLDLVLVDRDGTIVVDEPYNGDPRRVVPMPGARNALDELRARGIAIGVVSNQSGIGRGDLVTEQVEAVNATVEQLLGPFAGWWYCPHDTAAGCECRKPAPGLVHAAMRALGAPPHRCAMIGDTAADVAAAHAAGVIGVLVPNAATRPDEVGAAPLVAPTLRDAVGLLVGSA